MLIDLPIHCDIEEYDHLRDKIVAKYINNELVRSIYNIGSVTTPGISDIDFVLVFRDGAYCNRNPMEGLNRKEFYILKHNLFGLREDHWQRHFKFSVIQNYSILHSKDYLPFSEIPIPEISSSIKVQTALEYVLKFYIGLTSQISLNIFKVRSLLLELKSFRIDYKILGDEHTALKQVLDDILDLRENWFSVSKHSEYFLAGILKFYKHLKEYVKVVFISNTILFPFPDKIKYLNNILFTNGNIPRTSVSGTGKIIGIFGIKSNKFFNLANKFQKYHYTFPWKTFNDKESVLYKKYLFEKEMFEYNSKFLSHFLPLKSPLHIFSNE